MLSFSILLAAKLRFKVKKIIKSDPSVRFLLYLYGLFYKTLMNYELFNHQDKKIYLINMLREENQIFSELFEKGVEKYLRAGKKI